MVAMATILGAIPPFVGPIIYLFFRPPEYLEDVRERELEIRAMEERSAECDLPARCAAPPSIPSGSSVPVCTTRLKQACESCGAAARGSVADVPALRDADRPVAARSRRR